MILDDETKAALYIVMSTLLPETSITSLSLIETYLLREKVALIQGEVEHYRIQVENHLANLNSSIHSPIARKEVGNDLTNRIAKLLNRKGLNLDNLIQSLSD